MLNQEKVKDMTKMAIYESGQGGEELYITSYRRSDYVALQLIKSFVLGTISAGIILAFYYFMNEDILDKLNTLASVQSLVLHVIIFYVIFLAAYLVLTFFWARSRYKTSLAHAKAYTEGLSRVVRSYQTPEEQELEKQEQEKKRKPGFLKWRK